MDARYSIGVVPVLVEWANNALVPYLAPSVGAQKRLYGVTGTGIGVRSIFLTLKM